MWKAAGDQKGQILLPDLLFLRALLSLKQQDVFQQKGDYEDRYLLQR